MKLRLQASMAIHLVIALLFPPHTHPVSDISMVYDVFSIHPTPTDFSNPHEGWYSRDPPKLATPPIIFLC